MQNMRYYYDFSGQKFGYPLSLSINSFSRQVFSRHSSLEITYVLKGEYEVITENFSYTIKEHELVIIAPNDIHIIRPNSKEENVILTIHIDFSLFPPAMIGEIKEHELVIIAPNDIHIIRPNSKEENVILTIHIDFSLFPPAMIGEIKHSYESIVCTDKNNLKLLKKLKLQIGKLIGVLLRGNNNLFELNTLMMEVIYITSNHMEYPIERLPLQSIHRENYMKAIQYIDNHYQEDLRLTDVADTLMFSVSYTSKLFKQYTGIPFVKNYMKAIQYIDNHYQEDLRLTDVADTLMFSVSYTSKLFKQYTGIPFVKYVALVRIRESIESLLEGKKSIEQIAADCGMPNSKAYTTAFKELYGIVPSHYRKKFVNNLKFEGKKSIEQIAADCGMPNSKAYTTAFKELYGIVPSHYRKKFVNNLKFNEDKKDQLMSIDYNQRKLLEHLLEESENILYENAGIKIKMEEGHILCSIQTDKDVKSTITHYNDEIIVDIAKV